MKKGVDRVSGAQVDRRRNLRAPLIVMQIKMEDERNTFFGYARNISRGGMFISSINPAEPGSRFAVEFPLPDRKEVKVRCHCEVVWKRPFAQRGPYDPGMGLKFLDLSEESAEAINGWVQSED